MASPIPERRIQPTSKLKRSKLREPIEPRDERKVFLGKESPINASVDNEASAQRLPSTSDAVRPSETFFENLKNSLFNTVSFTTQNTIEASDDEVFNFEGPLVKVKRQGPATAAE